MGIIIPKRYSPTSRYSSKLSSRFRVSSNLSLLNARTWMWVREHLANCRLLMCMRSGNWKLLMVPSGFPLRINTRSLSLPSKVLWFKRVMLLSDRSISTNIFISLKACAWILWIPAWRKKTFCRFNRLALLKISSCSSGILLPDRSSTCISGSSDAGREVRPASGHRADFLPDVHLHWQTAGQSVQSGKAAAWDSEAKLSTMSNRTSQIRPPRGWYAAANMPNFVLYLSLAAVNMRRWLDHRDIQIQCPYKGCSFIICIWNNTNLIIILNCEISYKCFFYKCLVLHYLRFFSFDWIRCFV